jgi:hypothetical protein
VNLFVSLAMVFMFLTGCVLFVQWIFKTGYRLKN